MKKPGIFLTFEGLDGCGKSTALQATSAYLTDRGISHLTTREPGGTVTGEHIRTALLHGEDMSAVTELLLFAASFSVSVRQRILPALDAGQWILCDRFTDSTRAYQGGGRGLPRELLDNILIPAAEWCPELKPKKTFLFDLTAEEAAQRLQTKTSDRMEKEGIAFQTVIRREFLTLAQKNPSRFLVLDARRPPISLQEEIQRTIQPWVEDFLEEGQNS
jgi:dTMP kinase